MRLDRSSRLAPAFVLCLSAGLAVAQEAPPPVPTPVDATAHRHLGFYGHVDIGGGYLTSSASQAGASFSVKGASVLLSLAIGGAIAENWILAGELWGAGAPSPSGVTSSSSTVALSALGLNVTHYFMPANVFFSFTPSATILSIDNGSGTVGRTQVGVGARLALGKEWWVGNHWGIGLAAEGFFGFNRDQGTDPPTWSTFGGGLVFSATFN
jgi:hypothetical protein